MKAIFATLLIALTFPCNVSGQHVEADHDFAVAHINFDLLSQSDTGRQLAGMKDQPFVAKQLATIPEELAFLKQATAHSATIYYNNGDIDFPVIEIHAEADTEKLNQLLRSANQYACVQYREIDVHHWLTDLEKVGNQVMGETEQSDSSDSNIYLAMPLDDYYVISGSLSQLTEAVDRVLAGKPVSNTTRLADEFGSGENLFTWHSFSPEGAFPKEIKMVVREDQQGAMNVLIRVPCHSDTERTSAEGLNQLLNNPTAAAALLSGTQRATKPDVKPTPEPDSLTEVADQPTEKNRITFGLSFDSLNFADDTMGEAANTLLSKSVKSKIVEGTLHVDLQFFGRPGVVFESRHDSSTVDVNTLLFQLKAFSTAELREKAIVRDAIRSASVDDASQHNEHLKR